MKPRRSIAPQTMAENKPSGGQRIWRGRGGIGIVVALVCVAIYTAIAPTISRTVGVDLPVLTVENDGSVVSASPEPLEKAASNPAPVGEPEASSRPEPSRNSVPSPSPDTASEHRPAVRSDLPTKPDLVTAPELLYGRLKEVGNERFVSVAGLMYTPGSAEGHRLEHVRRHTVDDPGRPGSHGVFDGDMDGAIATIDAAYERAKTGQRTTKTRDQNRDVYTVDMGKRIGFVGGRTGQQRRHPMARRVRLVLEGNRVITAYPL